MSNPTAATDQANVSFTLALPSPTVSVTLSGVPLTALVEIVPAINPVLALMLRPDGSPDALYVSVPLVASLPATASDTESPPTLRWLLGASTVTR